MSYTQLNYPAAFASEGNPLAGGRFPGEYDPYVHSSRDTMWVNDEAGYFSVDVSHLPLVDRGKILKRRDSTWRDSPN